MLRKIIPKQERRKYKRLDTIFPVEFQILEAKFQPVSNWLQGFSQDVSKGGLCLTVNNLAREESSKLSAEQANFLLQIHSPISDRCFLAYAKLAWIKKIQELPFTQFAMGLSFTRFDTKEMDRFINYIRFKKILWRTLQFLVLGILLALAVVVTNNLRLNSKNLVLISQYSQLLNEDLGLKQGYKDLVDERESLNKELSSRNIEKKILEESIIKIESAKDKEISLSEEELSKVQESVIESEEDLSYIKELQKISEDLKAVKDEEIKGLQEKVTNLQEQEAYLKNKLAEVIARESELKDKFSSVEQEKEILAGQFKDQLYKWIQLHQNQRNGLIVSFEGDHSLKNVSYVYDQALATIAYTLFGDYTKAKKGLSFFLYKAKKSPEGGFYNAYYSNTGEVSEFVAHTGPNFWLGIAILQYSQRSKDYSYLKIAEQISQWAQSLQDQEGGIVAGRGISWYSTEHNLDGFAFFNMFYELTKDKQYKEIADKILDWLEKYSYNNESVPVNRGKGDSTIATDTYAWSISALGPERLKKLNMDPDAILEFAIENCLVKTEFTDRFSKNIIISGFDFAKHQHMPRGGVVSCEWTAQMILSFNVMSDYYLKKNQLKKSNYYQNEATKYIKELSRMAITSPSAFGQGAWCLPYASQENVDTGHGWRTPKGSRTGSVAATTYTIFAISRFNPFELSD